MTLLNTVKLVAQYLVEGFLDIFSPHEDQYPAIGVQPFGGTISHHSQFNW